MMMTLQQLRDIEDNKHIDSFIESDDSFNDWEKRSNPEYISTYYEMLSILYQIMDENDENKAIQCAEDEMADWMVQNIKKEDEVILQGKINTKMEVEVKWMKR